MNQAAAAISAAMAQQDSIGKRTLEQSVESNNEVSAPKRQKVGVEGAVEVEAEVKKVTAMDKDSSGGVKRGGDGGGGADSDGA